MGEEMSSNIIGNNKIAGPQLSPGFDDKLYTSMNVLLADAECAAKSPPEDQHNMTEKKLYDPTTSTAIGNHKICDIPSKISPVETATDIFHSDHEHKAKTEIVRLHSQSRYRRPLADTTEHFSEIEGDIDESLANKSREENYGNYCSPGRGGGACCRKREHTKLHLQVDTSTATDIYSENDDDGNNIDEENGDDDDEDDDGVSASPSEAQSEASFMVLLRYMGLSSRPYGVKPKQSLKMLKEEELETGLKHDLQVGDHVIRWKMLGYCYPMQVHGIVFSVRPDCVTIVDCGLSSSYSNADRMGSSFDEQAKETKSEKRERKRMNILTLVDSKEVKRWTKIRYGEEVELKVHSSNATLRSKTKDKTFQNDPGPTDAEIEQSSSAGLELEEECLCDQAKIRKSPDNKKISNSSPGAWLCSWQTKDGTTSTLEKVEFEDNDARSPAINEEEIDLPSKKSKSNLRLPKADPPMLVLARLRFLLEYGEEPFPPLPLDDDDDNTDTNNYMKRRSKKSRSNLLPPHHLLYANSECIAVFCKTGRWSTLQASVFLHTSTFGNAKQTATVAMVLSSQTVTVPASGFWGWFGGTTTISLFSAQPWLVPALVGGGMVYVGLPMLMLWKAKTRWANTEKRLNDAFWSMCDSEVTVGMIRYWSGLEG